MTVSTARALIASVMVTLLAIVAGGVFDQVRWEIVGATAGVAALAVLVGRFGAVTRAIVSVLLPLVALVLTVLADGGSITDAVPGVLSGPRRLLSTEWPSPVDPRVAGAISLLLAVTAVVTVELARRPRLHLTPLVPVTVTFVVLIALGAPVQPRWWLVVLLGAAAGLLALVRHEATESARPVRRLVRTDRTVLASIAALAVAALATSGAVAWADRANPRDTEDAETSAALLDPIEATVALRESDPELELFEITDRSTLIGRSLPSRWRLAALDEYDGQRWVPRLTVRPIGGRLGLPSPPSPLRPPPIRYRLEFLTDDIDLVPFPGRPLEISRDVETDLDRVVVRLGDAPEPGLVLDATSEIAPTATDARTTSFVFRQVDDIAATFTERASALAGDGNVLEQIQQIESTMRGWRLNPDAPGGGQQLALIERFVNDNEEGTREQFVTAFVLLVRSLGFDARVATGFVVPPTELDNPLTIRSTQAAAWPEVRLQGVGWVAFDPVPEQLPDSPREDQPQPEAQSPAAAQPPLSPQAEETDDPEDTTIELEEESGRWSAITVWAVRVGAYGGLAVLPFAIAIGGILVAKSRRRRKRLRAADPEQRIRGAWANATDSLIDAGLTIPRSWTDERIAQAGTPLAPSTPDEIRRLAAWSTAMTFGRTDDASALVDDAVTSSGAVERAIGSSRNRWQRIRWRLSLRSLRRSTRSPVAV